MDKKSLDSDKMSTENDLLELAKKELLRDIKCASVRAEQFGAHSWAKPQKYVPSKRFLKSMLMHNERKNGLRKESETSHYKESSSRSLNNKTSTNSPTKETSTPKKLKQKKRVSNHSGSRWETHDSSKRKSSRWSDDKKRFKT